MNEKVEQMKILGVLVSGGGRVRYGCVCVGLSSERFWENGSDCVVSRFFTETNHRL